MVPIPAFDSSISPKYLKSDTKNNINTQYQQQPIFVMGKIRHNWCRGWLGEKQMGSGWVREKLLLISSFYYFEVELEDMVNNHM